MFTAIYLVSILALSVLAPFIGVDTRTPETRRRRGGALLG